MKRAFLLLKYNILICCFGLLLILNGCAIDVPYRTNVRTAYDSDSQTPLVEFLIEPENQIAVNFNSHLRKAANYAKLPYRRTSLATFNSNPVLTPTTRVLVILDPKTINAEGMNTILNFVGSGGTLVFLHASQDRKFGYLAGLKQDAPYTTNDKATGFVFKNNFIPLMEGKSYTNNAIHFGLMSGNYSPEVEILATAINDPDYPTILKNKIGNGNVRNLKDRLIPKFFKYFLISQTS